MKGSPWSSFFKSNDVNSKHFLCALLKEYFAIGWHLKVATDLVYFGSSSSVVMFTKMAPFETNIACLSLNDDDKLRFIGPDSIVPYIRTAIMSTWQNGIQREKSF